MVTQSSKTSLLPRSNHHFTNWVGVHRCSPQAFFQPESEDELLEIVQWARRTNRQIRVVGAGHSWTDMACTPQVLINLDRMNRILHCDRETGVVELEAGIRLKDLNRELLRRGLALSNLGSVAEQSVAGVLSTATHGTGIRFGCIASTAKRLRLITGTGKIVDLSPELDRDHFSAAAVSMGSMGIISGATIQCEPAFRLEEKAWPLPWKQAIEELPSLVKQHEHVKFWWLPHTGTVQVYTYNRTDKPITPEVLPGFQRFQDQIANGLLFPGMLAAGKKFPFLIPTINRLVKLLHFGNYTKVAQSYDIFNLPMPPRHLEMEYAIPAEKAPEAMDRWRDMILKNGWKVSFIGEARFVAGDQLMMNPAYGRDTCYLGAYIYWSKDHLPYFRQFESLMAEYGGRPHWAKTFYLTPAQLAAIYPQWKRFWEIRQEFDPQGMFINDYIARIME